MNRIQPPKIRTTEADAIQDFLWFIQTAKYTHYIKCLRDSPTLETTAFRDDGWMTELHDSDLK